MTAPIYAEFDLIERIKRRFEVAEGVYVGIGDDCAVLGAGQFDLVTTDTMVQGVHFRLDWSSPADVGWKALAVSLSDVAAMGGVPGPFFLNLSLGPDADTAFVDGLLDGLCEICQWVNRQALATDDTRVSVVGGDLTATDGPTTITTTVMGTSAPSGAIGRGGAAPGDRIILFGQTGLAEAGLDLLDGRLDASTPDASTPDASTPDASTPDASTPGAGRSSDGRVRQLVRAHRRPCPLVAQGVQLGRAALASALVDISDGLIQDVGHIVDQSGVGAVIDADRLPTHQGLRAVVTAADVALGYRMRGGEDLALCATVPARHVDQLRRLHARRGSDADDVSLCDIGHIRPAGDGVCVVDATGDIVDVETGGYQHFVKK